MRATKTGWREKLPLWEAPFPHGSFFLFPAPETYAEVFMTGEHLNVFLSCNLLLQFGKENLKEIPIFDTSKG